MKVIFLCDVKGQGKKGDVKELQAGFANFLIKNGQAVAANDTHMAELEERNRQEALAKAKLLSEMKELKALIEKETFEIFVNLTPSGNIQGTVTTKHLAENVEAKLKIKLDKRKITFDNMVVGVGEYFAHCALHPEVNAKICFIVKTK